MTGVPAGRAAAEALPPHGRKVFRNLSASRRDGDPLSRAGQSDLL